MTEPVKPTPPRRRWFQFSLRTMFVLTAIAAWAINTQPYIVVHHQGWHVPGPNLNDPNWPLQEPERPDGAEHFIGNGEEGYWWTDRKRPNPELAWPGLALIAFLGWRTFENFRTRRGIATIWPGIMGG